MEESGQGIYPFHSFIWGLGLYWSFSLGVGVLFLCTSVLDVGTVVRKNRGLCEDGENLGIIRPHRIECWNCIYGSIETLVGSFKGVQSFLPPNGRYVQVYAFNANFIVLPLVLKEDLRQIIDMRLLPAGVPKVFSEYFKYSAASPRLSKVRSLRLMENQGVDELVVHLDRSLDLSTMEIGVKLVGMALAQRTLNRWGIRNILNSAWKELGELGIKWVRENLFIISVQDQSMANKILAQVPWAVMKKNFVVKT
ncbi:hypothetical protein PS2_034031 [Malus domestica]